MHPSPITLRQVILIFMLFVSSTGNKVLANSLQALTIAVQYTKLLFQSCFKVAPHFDPPNYLPVQFFSSLLTGNTCIHVSCYSFNARADLLLYFQVKYSDVF